MKGLPADPSSISVRVCTYMYVCDAQLVMMLMLLTAQDPDASAAAWRRDCHGGIEGISAA